MSKTNHRRDFKEPKPRRYGIMTRTAKLSDRFIGVRAGGDVVNGHRGEAKAKRGAKKRLRVLERLDGKRLASEAVNFIDLGG